MKHNFSAGPSLLPSEVYRKLSQAIIDFDGTGLSVLGLSHRGSRFTGILDRTFELMRSLLEVPSDYEILLMQGGAGLQFSLVPQNLMFRFGKAIYMDTGLWSQKAIAAARHFGRVEVPTISSVYDYRRLPDWDFLQNERLSDRDYLHITSNNTVYGTRFETFPETSTPLVADVTSDLMSRRIDVTQFMCLYASAQKNLGIAGLAVVMVKRAFIQNLKLPDMWSYHKFSQQKSLVNTPPTLAIYAMMLMLEWINDCGGVVEMERKNLSKARKLYQAIDAHPLLKNTVHKPNRSPVNITFEIENPLYARWFDQICVEQHIIYINGHRTVGGYRASLYNALSEHSVDVLIGAMQALERKVNH